MIVKLKNTVFRITVVKHKQVETFDVNRDNIDNIKEELQCYYDLYLRFSELQS